MVYPGGLPGPNTLTTGQIRSLIDRDRRIDIGGRTQPDQGHCLKVRLAPVCDI